jgi:hypothetical protein
MKNAIRFFVGIGLLVLAVCCSSCGEKSEAEMQQARQAMENAKSFFAEDLAPSDWKGAMRSWEQGQAAVKEGKPAKTYFLRAKSRFEKTAAIAKAAGDQMSRDVQTMQTAITERLSKVRADLDRSKLSPKVKGQIKPIAAEVEEESASIDSLVSQRNFVKAKTLAKDAQSKIYNAELILAGKKPNP